MTDCLVMNRKLMFALASDTQLNSVSNHSKKAHQGTQLAMNSLLQFVNKFVTYLEQITQ